MQYLAIVGYRCLVAGVPAGSLDIQVQWFESEDEATVRQLVSSEPIQCYRNIDEETVSWELVQIFAIEAFAPKDSGEEVIGFIASTEELADLA